jgi:predicted transposase YbfD/YdcC
MVSAFAAEYGVVLGQVKAYKKSNGITAIHDSLSRLENKWTVITIYAMGCPKVIFN